MYCRHLGVDRVDGDRNILDQDHIALELGQRHALRQKQASAFTADNSDLPVRDALHVELGPWIKV